MNTIRYFAFSCVVAFSAAGAQTGAPANPEKIDYATLARIKDEGLQRSQAMDHIS